MSGERDALARVDAPGGAMGSVPASVIATARAAFSAVDRRATTAELVSDSLDDDTAAESGRRVVAFAGGGVQVVVTVENVTVESGPSTAMSVSVTPAEAQDVEVHVHGEQRCTASPTSPGTWSVVPVPTGPVSFAVGTAEGPVRTAWTRF